MRRALIFFSAAALILAKLSASAQELDLTKAGGALRVACFNVHLARGAAGDLIQELRAGQSKQIAAVAEIIQRVRPDILLINEIDHDPDGEALKLFAMALKVGRGGADGIDYPHRFTAPSNTGLSSGLDINGDGQIAPPHDAYGWGAFQGQYAMAVLSVFPLRAQTLRSFRHLPWRSAVKAVGSDGAPFYAPRVARALRLSSKSHWDLEITTPNGALHLLASHPTPPLTRDGSDRLVLRNAEEILFWRDYIEGAHVEDDQGRQAPFKGERFVIAGDLNNDPHDGDGDAAAIKALLAHPLLQDPAPQSPGGAASGALDGGVNKRHKGPAAFDTADWRDKGGGAPGNLRVDYVLPSASLRVTGAGVFWPHPDDSLSRLVGGGRRKTSSDHHLVWVDVAF